MIDTIVDLRQINPFATRWVRPGAVPYCFGAGANAAQLLERLRDGGWRGAIVGPHGSGKSTLLATLVHAIEEKGIRVQSILQRDGQRRLPRDILSRIRSRAKIGSTRHKKECGLPNELLIVDGYEQLSWWWQRRLSAICRRNHYGLLVTAHRENSVGSFSILFRTAPELATVQYLVDHVLPSHGGAIHPDDVATAFTQNKGNVREALFSLYDLFQQRRSSGRR
jgi:hypothetical protein